MSELYVYQYARFSNKNWYFACCPCKYLFWDKSHVIWLSSLIPGAVAAISGCYNVYDWFLVCWSSVMLSLFSHLHECYNSCRDIIATHICCLLVEVLSCLSVVRNVNGAYDILYNYFWLDGFMGACSSAVCWGTALHVGRSRVRFPMVSLEFFIDIILPAGLWPWGLFSLYQKWVPGTFPGGKGGRYMGLTTLPPSCADCLEIWKPQPPGTLWACPGL